MKRSNLIRRWNWLLAVAALAIVSPGCGEVGNTPEPKKTGASRDFMEHPLDAAGKATKPLPPPTPKVKAALERAKQADPRGR
jgi:hypothetical protein